MDSVKMALESIRDKKIRSFLTMLGIIIGVGAVLILVSVVQGYNADLTAYYEKQGVNKVNVTMRNYDRSNTTDQSGEFMDWAAKALDDKILGISPSYSTSGTLKYYDNMNDTAKIYFGNEQWSVCNNFVLNKGRDLLAMDMEGRNLTCVLGSYVAECLFGYRDPIGETVMYNGFPLVVSGVYYAKDGTAESSMDDMIVVPYTLNRQILKSDPVNQFSIKVNSSVNMTAVLDSVEDWMTENFNTNTGSYTVENGNDAMDAVADETASLQVVLGGVKGKLMVYALDGSGVTYFDQQLQVSESLEGLQGTVLCDAAGKVCGFIPESIEFTDIVIDKADSGSVTAKSGKKYRLQSSVTVVAGEEAFSFAGNGSARLNSQAGKEARLYFGSDDAVTYIVVSSSAGSSSQAAVAATTSAADSLARALGITGKTYKITKNGKSVDASSLALYDVGYYDSGTDTLRTSDYRISGFIEAAEPGLTNAETITVCGCTLNVLECALDDMEGLALGSKAVFLLTDDLKVAAVRPSDFECEMIGVLSSDGRSVTLCSSGLQLKASRIKGDDKTAGSVVKVTCTDISTIKCEAAESSAAPGNLSIEDRTVGDLKLSADCRIYERAAEGAYVCSLDGVQGAASDDLDGLGRTGSLSKNYIGYYHTNGAGDIDVLVLNDVTGNCYTYGKTVAYTGNAGINLGSGSMSAYNDAVAVVNGNGTSQKAIDTAKVDEGAYAGIAFGTSASGNAVVKKALYLTKMTQNDKSMYFFGDDSWFVIHGVTEYRIAENVQIYYKSVDKWTAGDDSMTSLLADCTSFTLYYDKAPGLSGKVRVIVAE